MSFTTTASDQQWAAQRVATLPHRWQSRVLSAWERARRHRTHDHWTAEHDAQRAANLQLLDLTARLTAHRLPLDASDAEICDHAQAQADRCAKLADLYHQPETLHAAMVRIAEGQGIDPPKLKDGRVMPAIRRMVDPLWWRRQLRRHHAATVEGAAIIIGIVNRSRDPYVSDESLRRRAQQNRRNAATLEATIARNEAGQEFTLAELAAKSTANKAIRRAELMTRIAGFERIARECGHDGLFLTMTCPSRMHRWRTVNGGRVVENPRYDGTSPREAQAYLARVWARIRAALKRQSVGLYGFRIAEPQHDGTPHWHMLLFHEPAHADTIRATVTRYALADSPDEPGAHRHRVDFVRIDWERGTAAGYIAKYVAKNIDGHKVGQDLYGNDAMETSARVEAWAATWGIRQFQQIGGAPVTVWRELRRVRELPEGAPEHLAQAWRAVNKTTVIEGRDNASVAWDHYVKAQGGVFVGRAYRIRISTAEREGLGRYGEPLPPAPVGVETTSVEHWTPPWMAHMGARIPRVVHWIVESSRHVWEIVTRAGRGALEGLKRAIGAPWTRVNNCTGQQHGQPDHEPRSGGNEAARGAGAAEKPMERGTGQHPSAGRTIRGTDHRLLREPEPGTGRVGLWTGAGLVWA